MASLGRVLAFLITPCALAAQGDTARAVRLAEAVRMDGRLTENVWQSAPPVTGLLQREPNEGEPAPENTEVRFAYDEDALYVGARMYSKNPRDIRALITRRDQEGISEFIAVTLDTYLDRRTAYSFAVTPSGVRLDFYHASDDEDGDSGYDPVWQAEARIDSIGWTAEMRIPFNQLRFSPRDAQLWGLNVIRRVPARNEDNYWRLIRKDETGWASRMGLLTGIHGIAPSHRVEALPYVAGGSRLRYVSDPEDPFLHRYDNDARVGGDLKLGLGPNLTVDVTLNPDFGQVEADPAVVNLSAFEVFFDEKRPFFTEGAQLLRGNGPSYFYSRRIGASPACAAGGDFVECPQNASILGAAKVTGRLANGMSLGGLAAITGREHARTYDTTTSTFGRTLVAPTVGYGVTRLQQEFGASKSVVGLTLTAVQRDLEPSLAARYNKQAYSGGADWVLRWDRGAYVLRGWLGFSHIRGDAAAINRVQRSGVHFFQRPDASYIDYDPTRTSLTGSVANAEFQKTKGNFLYSFGYGWESPAYDPNDAGRLGNADGRFGFLNVNYRQTKPRGKLQNWSVGLYNATEYDFGGDRQYHVSELYGNFTFRNFWNINTYFDWFPSSFDHSATRGGPTMRTTASWNYVIQLSNSFGAKTSWNGRVYYGEDELGGETYRLSGRLSIRPSTRFQFSATPNYLRAIGSRQYVTTFGSGGPPETYGSRYVFARIDQSTFLMQLRANYTIGPDLSLELYGEPFAASGKYYGLGELARARTFDLREYGTSGTTIARDSVGNYIVTDNGGADTLNIANPDFNILSFRSNAVLRWEWRPGSTLFLVWAQDRFGFTPAGKLVGFSELVDSFGAQGSNFLAVKISYWIPVK